MSARGDGESSAAVGRRATFATIVEVPAGDRYLRRLHEVASLDDAYAAADPAAGAALRIVVLDGAGFAWNFDGTVVDSWNYAERAWMMRDGARPGGGMRPASNGGFA